MPYKDYTKIISKFLSTPSARRATLDIIHKYVKKAFLSTPSARRATGVYYYCKAVNTISIHALREEGDIQRPARQRLERFISIHALREEGDQEIQGTKRGQENFYPRPPRGGRRLPSSVRASS